MVMDGFFTGVQGLMAVGFLPLLFLQPLGPHDDYLLNGEYYGLTTLAYMIYDGSFDDEYILCKFLAVDLELSLLAVQLGFNLTRKKLVYASRIMSVNRMLMKVTVNLQQDGVHNAFRMCHTFVFMYNCLINKVRPWFFFAA